MKSSSESIGCYLYHAALALDTLNGIRPRKESVARALRTLDLIQSVGIDLSKLPIGDRALQRIAQHKLK